MIEKKDNLTPLITINPTLPENAKWLPSIEHDYNLIEHYKSVRLVDLNTHAKSEVVFTHPMFLFEKPNRRSKKTGKWKAAAEFFAVFNPDELGSGKYGSTYHVVGVWKCNNSEWIFKTKQSPELLRLVKTDFLKQSKACTSNKLIKIYRGEQLIGKWVDHMGLKYPVTSYNSHPFLLMREQEGSTLKNILNQLKANPNALSIIEKLTITINLLKAVDTQVSSIKTPKSEQDNESYLVHCDLKPDNIIIDSQLNIKFIDYGLAKANTTWSKPRGTPLYMDSHVLEGLNAGQTSDLFSVSRIIGELWGDVSSVPVNTMDDLLKRNREDRLTDLLHGILGLTDDEKINIPKIIGQMIPYEIENRLTREQALKLFEDLLQKRLALKADTALSNLIKKSKSKDLNVDELMFILKSSKASDFLKQFNKDPLKSGLIGKTLGNRLLELDDNIILEIGKHPLTVEELIKNPDVTMQQIAKLIKSGAPVKPASLSYWLTWVWAAGQELKWAGICRLLYNATANADKVLDKMKKETSFNYLYCQRFLRNKQVSLDEELNVRLLKQHVHVLLKQKPRIDSIIEKLSQHFKNAPFALNLLQALDKYQSNLGFLLVEESRLPAIESTLLTFHTWVNKAKFDAIGSVPNRFNLINALETQLISIQQLEDWDVARVTIERCVKDIMYLNDLDKAFIALRNAAPKNVIEQLTVEADEYYSLPKDKANKLIARTKVLCTAFDFINSINKLKNGGGLSTEVIDNDFDRIILKPSLRSTEDFYKTIVAYHKFYSTCHSLFHFIKKTKTFTSQCHLYIENSIKAIQDMLTSLVCAEKVSEIMPKLREQIQTMMPPKLPSQYESRDVFYSPIKGKHSQVVSTTATSSTAKKILEL